MYGGPLPFDDEDFGGHEGSDGEDEEDVQLPTLPPMTTMEMEMTTTTGSGLGGASPFWRLMPKGE